MNRIVNKYWWAALAALGMVSSTILGGTAESASPNRQAPARMASNNSSLRITQASAATFQPSPVTPAKPLPNDGSETPFADDPENGPDNAAADSGGDGLWQPPPTLPSCDSDGCQSCWDNTCCAPRCGCWYGGADYLLAKPHFSQGLAAINCITVTNPNTNTVTDTQNSVPFPFKNSSMYRVFFGYHLSDCGGDINFTYWNLQSTAAVGPLGPVNASDSPSTFILGQSINSAGQNGVDQFLSASSGIRANVYDIDFSKYLIYGGPGRPCDCNFCPRWDLRWLGGVRIAQVNRFDNNVVTNASDGSIAETGAINANFYGAGPKIGFQARRYIGQAQRLSVFAKGSASLLLGQYHFSQSSFQAGFDGGLNTVGTSTQNSSRVIPVTDIEVGGTYQLYPSCFITAGYFVQCWWDLGYGETISNGVGSSAVSLFGSLDTANIMAWTGLFVRAELFF